MYSVLADTFPVHLNLLIEFVLFCFILPITNTLRFDDYDYRYRLPTDLRPIIYDIKLSLSSNDPLVHGQVRIQIQCENATDTIRFHINPLFMSIRHSSIESPLLNLTVDLGLPHVDWSRFVASYALENPLIRGSVYYLNIWFTTQYSDGGGGLIKYEETVRQTSFKLR
ncbi:hypothetical protein AB6A40_006569 [Gnathostoma spinigerum]|uniref:Aminopeptidase N-like N-terminal domain-containing protein n=1 Tax=Gnathostoma spinigerum TaxID=75299 RepID=A0ABD6EUD7_9BILA